MTSPNNVETTLNDLRRVERDCQKLVRDLALDLEQALIGFKDPSPVAEPHQAKFKALVKEMEERAKFTPQTQQFFQTLRENTRRQIDDVIRRAKHAHDTRGRVDGRFANEYNRAVAEGLTAIPREGSRAARRELDKGVRQLVDRLVRSDQVPGHVRDEVARSLSDWAAQQPLIDDAFFAVEQLLTQFSSFMHTQLAIRGQIGEARTQTEQARNMTLDQATALDERVAAFAEQANESEQALARFRPVFNLNPRLVLDPGKKYLSSIDARMGLRIEARGVKIDLGTRVNIVDPMLGERTANATGSANVTAGAFSARAQYDRLGMVGNPTESGHRLSTGLNFRRGDLDVSAGYEHSRINGQAEQVFKVGFSIRF